MVQGEAARSTAGKPADFWQSIAKRFRPPSDPTSDPAPDVLASMVSLHDRVIDVGAGGGRIAIPLSRRCRELVAVEPSPSMRAVLADEVARNGMTNIRIVESTWEDAEVEPAELVFAAHVTYGVQAIEPFIRKLDALATRWAALVAMKDPPQTPIAPFWRAVHGEERLRLPCRDELIDVLRELGVEPDVLPLPPLPVQSFGPPEEAMDFLRFRLIIGPETPADERLRACFADLTFERDGQVWPRSAQPNARAILRWKPGLMR
jgi:SAM-dependent methyltransferase